MSARTLADAREALEREGSVVLATPKVAGTMTIIAAYAVLVVSVLLLVAGILQLSWGENAWFTTLLGAVGIVFCVGGLLATRKARAEKARVELARDAITINDRRVAWGDVKRVHAIRIGPAVGKRGPRERVILDLTDSAASAWRDAGGKMTVPRGGARRAAEVGIDVPEVDLFARDVVALIDELRSASAA